MSRATTVVICTINRPTIVDETLRSLLCAPSFQSEIVVSSGSETSLLPETAALPQIRFVDGVKGLTRQRNAALRLVESRYVLFLDDDVELDPGYIDRMEALLDGHPEIVIASGHAVLDRLETRALITREMALGALTKADSATGWEDSPRWIRGHNMFVRTEVARLLGFDEQLPLYALYEDLDFVARCQNHGKAVRNLEARMVHLGTMSGRINEVRLGYSQFANSCYLVRKGIWAARVVARVCAVQFARNLVGSLLIRRSDLADRRSRLKGNLFDLADLFRGRLDPQKILVL
jgi:GT2 family glycosyltransferase